MKILLTIAAAAVLAGCATAPPASRNYATTYAPPPADPSQWHVVSVTPVPPGTRDRVAASADGASSVQYSSEPLSAYAPRPVYGPPPQYLAPPMYVAPPMYAPAPSYYYPPVSIGLDFMFGRSWGGHHHRGKRSWGGVGIGSRWHR